MHSHARFLKDPYTTERPTVVSKRAFLAFNVSHKIFQPDSYIVQGPQLPFFSMVTCNQTIYRALLDFGVSMNFLPFTMYERVELGQLRCIKVLLALADRSTRAPMGVLEDVLIKMWEFIFPLALWYSILKGCLMLSPIFLWFWVPFVSCINCTNKLCDWNSFPLL